jgi:hypothetical protein
MRPMHSASVGAEEPGSLPGRMNGARVTAKRTFRVASRWDEEQKSERPPPRRADTPNLTP